MRYCDSASARALIGTHRHAATGSSVLEVAAEVRILRHTLAAGGALDACLQLQVLAPRDLTGPDGELYAAGISLAAALWHVETGTDAGPALGAARTHLAAALAPGRPAVTR